MSADNWTTCPRCTARRELLAARVRVSYGAVPLDEFIKSWESLKEDGDSDAERPMTFREGYEIYGAETGTVTVDYRGECQKCGLLLIFKHEHVIPGWKVSED